ncbi:MAG: phosphopantetheine adenylyltransferase, partial [Gammaproteobacteria bacterium]|nr:phosphopantetheine adenylyltransferase [Gammaproteobacteria bacterium]
LGTYLLVAAFMPALQPSALAVGLVSVLSFLLLAWTTDGYNASIARVVTADVIALVALLIGTAAYFIIRSRTWPAA